MKTKGIQLLVGGLVLSAALLTAQNAGPMLRFTATTANVKGAPDAVRIDLIRWSTDAEREKFLSAWEMKGASGAPTRGAAGGRSAVSDRASGAATRTRPSSETSPSTPEDSLDAALKKGTTVGYIWSSEAAGYAIRYAAKIASPDGGDRIILLTDRRLGKTNELWTPVGPGTPSTYDFSVLELRVNSKGDGEGKASLAGTLMLDAAAKSFALENYAALPVIFRNVKQKGN